VRVAAVVVAAGLSTRMGAPKQLLPWGESTVIETVVERLSLAGAEPIVVVSGHHGAEVAACLEGSGATVVSNPDFGRVEMLRSVQVGLRALEQSGCAGALVALGDQPHVPVADHRAVVDEAKAHPDAIVIPSFDMRRGHPLYLPATLWDEVLALGDEDTLRRVLNEHGDRIVYVVMETPDVLRDIDTPGDYVALRPPGAP